MIFAFSIVGDGEYDWYNHVCVDQCEYCGKCTSDCGDPVCAEKCGCTAYTFNGMDDRIVVSGYPKNNTELCIAGRNNCDVTVTFTINASKAGTYKLYLNNSANSSVVPLNQTFTLSIGDKSYVSTENGHAYDSGRGASSRFFDYILDYYGEVELVEGTNTIVLTIIDDYKSAVNVKDFVFVTTDSNAVLTFAE